MPSVEKTIAFKEKINKNETNEYSLIVEYLNLEEDQSIDMGSTLSLRVQIKDSEEVIEISSAEQLKALSRLTAIPEMRSYSYNSSETIADFSLLGINYTGTTYEKFKEELSKITSSNLNIISDINIELCSEYGEDFFLGMGNTTYPYYGNVYGNNHTIILGQKNDLSLLNLGGLGLFNYIENGSISDLNLTLSSDLTFKENSNHLTFGLLNGKAKNTNFSNINININSKNIINEQNDTSKSFYIGLLNGEVLEKVIIKNININLENTNIKNVAGNESNKYTYSIGLISPKINSTREKRNIIDNININLQNSNLGITTNRIGQMGSVAGNAQHSDFKNITTTFIDSSMTLEASDAKLTDAYDNLALGGILGIALSGSDNQTNLGQIGVTMDNCNFISQNTNKMETLKATENKGGGVTVGGIVGMTYNNFQITNSNVVLNNVIMLAERKEENTTIAKYGTQIGGIAARTEHTSSINNCKVDAKNTDMISRSTEKNIYIGGISGASMGPVHRDIIPLENNQFNGNNSTNLNLEIITGSNENTYNCIGGLTGESFYINDNNSVSNINLNIYMTGIPTTNKNYVSNFIGKYYNLPYYKDTTPIFTPRTSEIINSKINNVNINIDDNLKDYITIKNY